MRLEHFADSADRRQAVAAVGMSAISSAARAPGSPGWRRARQARANRSHRRSPKDIAGQRHPASATRRSHRGPGDDAVVAVCSDAPRVTRSTAAVEIFREDAARRLDGRLGDRRRRAARPQQQRHHRRRRARRPRRPRPGSGRRCQPVGTIRLKMISTIIVNAAWPAMNDATSGTYAEPNTTTGSSIHSTTGSTPTHARCSTAPRTNPIVVPTTARSIFVSRWSARCCATPTSRRAPPRIHARPETRG